MARALSLFQQIDRYSAPTHSFFPLCEGYYRFLAGRCAATMKSAYIYKVGWRQTRCLEGVGAAG